MTDEEIDQHYDAMMEMFQTTLPHPEREPKRFGAYVKMYRYALDRQQENITPETIDNNIE